MRLFLLFIFNLLLISGSFALTIEVPDDYASIQTAINAVNSFDTILVSPGIYNEHLNFNGKSIILKSTDGAELTTISGSQTHTPVINISTGEVKGTSIEGFTITGGDRSGVYINGAAVDIRENIFTGNYNSYNFSGGAIWLESSVGSKIERNIIHDNHANNYGGGIYIRDNSSSDTIAYNVFYDNTGTGEIFTSGSTSNIIVYNNTITGSRDGIHHLGHVSYFYNNLIFGNEGSGIYDRYGTATINYNCLYDNFIDINGNESTVIGPDNIMYLEGELRNYFQNDFTILPYSPCIDAGDPSPLYNDPDGSRNDIGALPYEEFSPAASLLSLGRVDSKDHIVSEPPHFCFHYFDSLNPMSAARIEVDTSFEFSGTPYWASGDILPIDTCFEYGGIPLQDSVTYYYRIQVSDGIAWSDWSVNFFRMNAKPTVPIPNHPTALEFVSNTNVNLIVESSTDSENDTITYDFELSEDIDFTVLTGYKYGIEHQDNIVSSGQFEGLPPAVRYYWRCRTFDGYEYSEWSDTESFITRSPTTHHVPGDFGIIQSAINNSVELDSIIVAPGIYSGTGNRDLNFNGLNLILVGSGGADSTIIDCGGTDVENHRGFLFENGEDSTSVIDGFTVTNAYLNWGAAIELSSGGVTIKNCKVEENNGFGIRINWGLSTYIDNCLVTNNTFDGCQTYGNASITNSLFAYNGWSGIYADNEPIIRNCTFVYNGQHGMNLEGSAPKGDSKAANAYGALITNNIAAYNGSYGIFRLFLFIDSINCNTSFANDSSNWYYYFPSDPSYGNDSLNPIFCDPGNGDFRLQEGSPCLPANNVCNQLRGAFSSCDYTSCCIGIRGNVDYDNEDQIDIADLVYLVAYSFQGGPAPSCFEEADIDGDSGLDIGDIVYLVQYIFLGGAPPLSCP